MSTIGSKKLDDYAWNFVKKVYNEPDAIKRALKNKITKLEAEQGDIEAEAEKLQHHLDNLIMERQWVITQARKGIITNKDMEMQLAALQLQEVELENELDESKASVAARRQAKALREWAKRYLTNVNEGIKARDINPEVLTQSNVMS